MVLPPPTWLRHDELEQPCQDRAVRRLDLVGAVRAAFRPVEADAGEGRTEEARLSIGDELRQRGREGKGERRDVRPPPVEAHHRTYVAPLAPASDSLSGNRYHGKCAGMTAV